MQLLGIFTAWTETSNAITRVAGSTNGKCGSIIMAFDKLPNILYYYRKEYNKHMKLEQDKKPVKECTPKRQCTTTTDNTSQLNLATLTSNMMSTPPKNTSDSTLHSDDMFSEDDDATFTSTSRNHENDT
eukprot:7528505-Ditylum_brightwellii.AAC.1